MTYTNSPLVSYTKLSPNNSGTRTHAIDRITISFGGGQSHANMPPYLAAYMWKRTK